MSGGGPPAQPEFSGGPGNSLPISVIDELGQGGKHGGGGPARGDQRGHQIRLDDNCRAHVTGEAASGPAQSHPANLDSSSELHELSALLHECLG